MSAGRWNNGTVKRLRALLDAHSDLALTKDELCKALGVVDATIERAITELRSEGYLQSGHVYWKADAQR